MKIFTIIGLFVEIIPLQINKIIFSRIKSFIWLFWLYYVTACNELAGLIFGCIAPRLNIATFEEMSQWWRANGNSVPNSTGLRFEH